MARNANRTPSLAETEDEVADAEFDNVAGGEVDANSATSKDKAVAAKLETPSK